MVKRYWTIIGKPTISQSLLTKKKQLPITNKELSKANVKYSNVKYCVNPARVLDTR